MLGAAVGVFAERDELARVGVKGFRPREKARRMAVSSQPQVDDVELAQLAEPQLVGIEAFVAAHGVHGVGSADALQQRMAAKQLVGIRVVRGHATFVAPEEVDYQPVDRLGAVDREAFVARPRSLTTRERYVELLARSSGEGGDDLLGESPCKIVRDY